MIVLVLANPRPNADSDDMAKTDSQVLVTTMLVKDILNVDPTKGKRDTSTSSSSTIMGDDENKGEQKGSPHRPSPSSSSSSTSSKSSSSKSSKKKLSSKHPSDEPTDSTPLLSLRRGESEAPEDHPDLDRDLSLTSASTAEAYPGKVGVGHRPLIVSEIGDTKTKNLVGSFRPLSQSSGSTESDWVVSNELVAMALTHMAQSINNQVILGELFDFDGSEIYLKDHRYRHNHPHNTTSQTCHIRLTHHLLVD
jgi:hypothetical protein